MPKDAARPSPSHDPPEDAETQGADRNATRPPAGSENEPAFDAQAETAVHRLRATGCPLHSAAGNGARDAVAAALVQGWNGAQVLAAVEGWLAYADTDAGRGIAHKGFFTGARIRRLESPPALPREEENDWHAYLVRHLDRIIRH